MKYILFIASFGLIFFSSAKDFYWTNSNVFNSPIEDASLNGRSKVSGIIVNFTDKRTRVTLNQQPIAVNDSGYFETSIVPNGFYSFKIECPDKQVILLDSLEFLPNHIYHGDFQLYSNLIIADTALSAPIYTYKPAIYFYPDSVTEVHARLYPMGSIDFSYPKYQKDGWTVTAHPDGTLKQGNKSYDYIFWDGPLDISFPEEQFSTGWIVSSDSLVGFFETTLSDMGLNESERNDFITYWVPKLKKNKRNLIHFLMNKAYDDIAHLKVYPKPQSSLRMMMLYFDAEEYELNPKPQVFPEFKRDGFTVIEWGGAQANIIIEPTIIRIPRIGKEVDKPVIYLYSEKTQPFELSFDFKGKLNFTHPKYDGSWKGIMHPNGDLVVNNQVYDYLFWEGSKTDLHSSIDMTIGSIVKRDELEPFLEGVLTQMNFNDREIQDFMCYWVPRMMVNDQNFIHFICNETYDEVIARMNISPTPDQMIRLFMVWGEINTNQEKPLAKQTFQTIKRTGFTLVEWGGSEIEINDLSTP